MTSGIYRIINIKNNKYYIGSSFNIENRFAVHKSNLRGKRHSNPYLQAAWNKYGEDAFCFDIIEVVPKSKCRKVEQKYLDKADFSKLYNIATKTNNGMAGRKHTKESKAKISKNRSGIGQLHTKESKAKMSRNRKGKGNKPITIDGVKYKTSREAEAALGIPKSTILYRAKSKNYPNYKY